MGLLAPAASRRTDSPLLVCARSSTLRIVLVEIGFRIGDDRTHLAVTNLHRPAPSSPYDWDHDWMTARIDVRVEGLRGHVDANLRAENFLHFRDELRFLYETLNGAAVFKSMEPYLEIDVTGDGRGHFRAECVVRDGSIFDIVLKFPLAFDQTELAVIVRELDAVCDAFPVRRELPNRKK